MYDNYQGLLGSEAWRPSPLPRVRQNNKKRARLYMILSISLCLIFWRAMSSVQEIRIVETSQTTTMNSPQISVVDGRQKDQSRSSTIQRREYTESQDDDELLGTDNSKDSAVVSESQFRKLEKALAEMISDTKQQLLKEKVFAVRPKSGKVAATNELDVSDLLSEEDAESKSKNTTPDESIDSIEPDLKGVAVAPKGKEPPKGIAKSLGITTVDHESSVVGEKVGNGKPREKLDESQSPKRADFPSHDEFVKLDTMADGLPDVVHISFEDATEDVTLQGWEDEWLSEARFNATKWNKLEEPKIDFVYTWVNGSEKAFTDTILPYEKASVLNDPEGKWLKSHQTNRYRDWDELRYSIRTVERHAQSFRGKIQLLVNSVGIEGTAAEATPESPAKIVGKQTPTWLKDDQATRDVFQILSQEDFFDEDEQGCLPTFNSLTIENQIWNTPSDVDRFFSMSDDMFLGKAHAASDLYSPLFGPTMGFKTNSYNTKDPPTDIDARRFGEKPFLIYTSWLLNRRFGGRKRKGQVHFGHSMSRRVSKEAIKSFPRPALQSNCQRFRGETGFQLYSWYVAFHYTIERHREALLWSYLMLRSDTNQDGNLGWAEREIILADLEQGMANEGNATFRERQFYQVPDHLENAGLEAPKVNVDVLWTSLDGPSSIRDIECLEFNVNDCLAPGFSSPAYDERHSNPVFSTSLILDRVARQHPKCGDCLIKLILNRAEKGFEPLLPPKDTQAKAREMIVKALIKYQYSIIEPDAQFVMVMDAEQIEQTLLKRIVRNKKEVGQLCLNDDVATENEDAIEALRKKMVKLFHYLGPEKSQFEKD